MAKGEKAKGRSAADHAVGREAEDAASLEKRLARLSDALESRQQAQSDTADAASDSTRQSLGAANLGFRALVEFVTAVVVTPLVGWQIDVWLRTGPVFLIIFLILGMVAGLVNVYRIAVGPGGPKK